MITPDPGAAQPAAELVGLLAAAWAQAAASCARNGELRQWSTQVLTEARAGRRASAEARRRRRSSPLGRDLIQRSEHARLLARLESMPVIEQAKGIIMAQSHCGGAQAFDLLRRASQRSNVPVRDLAAQIMAKTLQVSPSPVGHSRQMRRVSGESRFRADPYADVFHSIFRGFRSAAHSLPCSLQPAGAARPGRPHLGGQRAPMTTATPSRIRAGQLAPKVPCHYSRRSYAVTWQASRSAAVHGGVGITVDLPRCAQTAGGADIFGAAGFLLRVTR